MKFSVDRSGWKRVRLGEVVRHVTERVDSGASDLERFLAGEHIPSNDLDITEWGVIGRDPMGPMFYKAFRPGHVLYVSRRSYLRKTAVPNFDGITGEKTFVLQTRDEKVLDQRLLPFIVSTESFHSYAVANSRGSVNPYINWTELASYEFEIPPVETQHRLSDLLWSAENHRVALKRQASLALKIERELFEVLLTNFSTQGRAVRIGDVATVNPEQARGWDEARVVRYVDISSVRAHGGGIDDALVKSLNFGDAPGRARRVIREGDVLVSTVRPALRSTARVEAWLEEELASTGFAVVRASNEINPEFLWFLVNGAAFTNDMIAKSTGSNYPAVRANDLENFEFRLPDLGVQAEIVLKMRSAVGHSEASQIACSASDALLRAINEFMLIGGEL
ncbi:MAG: restriction endonuclease subunit S [Mycobacterium sp.]